MEGARQDEYRMISPDGQQLRITPEVFKAYRRFLNGGERPSGSVTVEFKTGGVAGVKVNEVLK